MDEATYLAKREALISKIKENMARRDQKQKLAETDDPGMKQFYLMEAKQAQEQVDKYSDLKDQLDRRYES